MSEVQTSLSYFLRRQMLFLASAGESAFGTLSRPDLPQGVARWFHMSVSKNTVARFAMERDHLRTTAAEPSGGDAAAEPRGGAGAGTLKEEETLLINLDADNVMAEQYPKILMKAAEPGYQRGLGSLEDTEEQRLGRHLRQGGLLSPGWLAGGHVRRRARRGRIWESRH